MYQFMSRQLRSPCAFVTIRHDHQLCVICNNVSLLFFADNLEICATNNTKMSLQSFRVDSNEILL